MPIKIPTVYEGSNRVTQYWYPDDCPLNDEIDYDRITEIIGQSYVDGYEQALADCQEAITPSED